MLSHWPRQRRSQVQLKGIFSGEKFNYNVMLGFETAFSPWNEGLFRNVLVKATQGNQVYCFHPIRQSQCVINLFYSHPCACHSAIRFRDAGIITFQQHDTVFAVWKWHTIITRPGTEIARAQQSIPYRKRVESNSVSQSVTLPALSRGASRPPLQLTSGAPTSSPMWVVWWHMTYHLWWETM